MPKIIEGNGNRRQPRRPGSNIQWESESPGRPLSISPGDRFDRLVAVKYEFGRWVCHCDCGKITRSTTALLKAGKKKSCGCLKDSLKKTDANDNHDAWYDIP